MCQYCMCACFCTRKCVCVCVLPLWNPFQSIFLPSTWTFLRLRRTKCISSFFLFSLCLKNLLGLANTTRSYVSTGVPVTPKHLTTCKIILIILALFFLNLDIYFLLLFLVTFVTMLLEGVSFVQEYIELN